MCKDKYEILREQYPEYISQDQLYKICRISKYSASYLINNGIIPVIDTGKKTWRYRISLEDVIAYLKVKEINGSMIPKGVAKPRKSPKSRLSYSTLLENGSVKKLREYFSFIYEDYPDALNTKDVVEMTGLCKDMILQHIKQGAIKSIRNSNRFVIPKESLLDYVSSSVFIDTKSKSKTFERILGGFQIWISAA